MDTSPSQSIIRLEPVWVLIPSGPAKIFPLSAKATRYGLICPLAFMAKYNPFAEKAGMQKIAEQLPPKVALAIAKTLRRPGFNIQFLGSEKYVKNARAKRYSLKVAE